MHPLTPRQSPARNSPDKAVPHPTSKAPKARPQATVDFSAYMGSLGFTRSAGGCLQLSATQLILATGATPQNAAKCLGSLNEVLIEFNISTALRICHFLAQVGTETGFFRNYSENLNYTTAERIKQMLNSKDGTRFPTVDSAKQYVRNPVGLANYAYGRRMGNIQEEDGFRFIGRGAIHLTGRANYEKASKDLGMGTQFLTNPGLVETPEHAFRVAGWFWKNNNLNELADADNLRQISKKVNGGSNGYPERVALLRRAKLALIPSTMPDVAAWSQQFS